MVFIQLTGNYTFFNILTVLLCLPCFGSKTDNTQYSTKISRSVKCCGALFLFASGLYYFDVIFSGRNAPIALRANFDLDDHIEFGIGLAWKLVLLSVLFSSIDYFDISLKDLKARTFQELVIITCKYTPRFSLFFFYKCVLVICIGFAFFPVFTLNQNYLIAVTKGSKDNFGIDIFASYMQSREFGISNSYGLFRSMTGMI